MWIRTIVASLLPLYHRQIVHRLLPIRRFYSAPLNDLNHRNRNNLQLISSLMRLEGDSSENIIVKRTLTNYVERIMTIALVEDCLNEDAQETSVELRSFLKQLTKRMIRQYGRASISCTIDSEPLHLNFEIIVRIALVISESLRRNLEFAPKLGEMSPRQITLFCHHFSGICHITIADSGLELLPPDHYGEFNPSKILLGHLSGEVRLEAGKLGVVQVFSFPY